jgi:hypothetical protein
MQRCMKISPGRPQSGLETSNGGSTTLAVNISLQIRLLYQVYPRSLPLRIENFRDGKKAGKSRTMAPSRSSVGDTRLVNMLTKRLMQFLLRQNRQIIL